MSEFNFTKVTFFIICLAVGCSIAQLVGFEVPVSTGLIMAVGALSLAVPIALVGVFGWELSASAIALISLAAAPMAYLNYFIVAIGVNTTIATLILAPLNAFYYIGLQKYLTRTGG